MTQPLTERLRSVWPTGATNEAAGARLMDEAADCIDALEATQAELVEALKQIAANNWKDQTRARHVARSALTKLESGQ